MASTYTNMDSLSKSKCNVSKKFEECLAEKRAKNLNNKSTDADLTNFLIHTCSVREGKTTYETEGCAEETRKIETKLPETSESDIFDDMECWSRRNEYVSYENFCGKRYKSKIYEDGFILDTPIRRNKFERKCATNTVTDASDYSKSEWLYANPSISIKKNENMNLALKRRMLSYVDIDLLPSEELKTMTLMTQGQCANHYETPLGRLYRLGNELDELREFVVSYIKDEESEKITSDNNVLMSTEKRLLFGHDVKALQGEIESLQEQINHLVNDSDVQKLFANENPVIQEKSCYEFVSQHLNLAIRSINRNVQKNVVIKPINSGDVNLNKGTNKCEEEIFVEKCDDSQRQDPESIALELYSVPSSTPILQTCRISQLERRLIDIENRIGISKMFLLPFPDILTGLNEISEKLALLDPQKIDNLGKRAQELLNQLENLKVNNLGKITTPEIDEQIDKLFQICEKWKKTTYHLPYIIKRLKSLKILHNEAIGMAVRVKAAEGQQLELSRMVEELRENFLTLKNLASENLVWMESTVENFNTKINHLQKVTAK